VGGVPLLLPEGYVIRDGVPDVDAYLQLRRRAGLSPKTPAQAAGAGTGSWYGCHVLGPDGDTVAMGRIIGDGGWYFHIADMATVPEHQRRGLGAAILDGLLARIRHHAPDGAYVTLLADEPGRALYRRFGFVESAPNSIGMQLTL
jgi:ribosomal protein S18 acetylase RimI-like enzyme